MSEDIEIKGIDEDDSDGNNFEGSIYDPKAEFKKPVLAMEAVRNCREARAKEMSKGFWNTKLDRNGNAIKTWIQDERKIFINSVIALEKLLSAECQNDSEFIKFRYGDGKQKGIQEKIDGVFEKYAYEVFEFDEKSNGWKKTSNKFIPQLGEELLVPSPHNPKMLVNSKGGWDFKVNAYYDELVPLYDTIFEELNKVIFRLNDFAEKYGA